MKMKANSGGGNFEACPAGNHPAVLVAIVDLGTQEETFQGETKKARKGFFCWYIPEGVTDDEKPYYVGREYTLSFHEKAALRKLVESWRNKPFAENEEFDLQTLLGKACLLNVVNETKKDKTFSKIAGVSSLPKGMSKPEAPHATVFFDLDANTTDEFPEPEWMPWSYGSKLIDIAMRSPEWRGESKDAAPAASKEKKKETVPPDDDDVPF